MLTRVLVCSVLIVGCATEYSFPKDARSVSIELPDGEHLAYKSISGANEQWVLDSLNHCRWVRDGAGPVSQNYFRFELLRENGHDIYGAIQGAKLFISESSDVKKIYSCEIDEQLAVRFRTLYQ